MKYDIVIIGAGPSGLTAGIYAVRAGMSVAIVEKQFAGGQIASAENVENYPAFNGISGVDLSMKMLEQAESLGVKMIYDTVVTTSLKADIKVVKTENNGDIEASAVILCAGANARKLGVADEERLIGKGVSYCALCDGAFYKGKRVAVIGGGNTAIGDALYLAKFASEVYLVHRRDEFRATKSELDKLAKSIVQPITSAVVSRLVGKDKLEGLVLESVIDKSTQEIAVDGVFVAIGQIPASDSIAPEVERDAHGYIIGDEDMKTNIDGVFVAGDVRQKKVRQVITAASDGAIAAEMAVVYISNLQK